MQRIRAMIAARNQKIKEMQENFEPSERIAAYKATSLTVIKVDYLKKVKELQQSNKAKMDAIASEYHNKAPSIRERSEHLTVLKTRYRAMSVKQLEKSMDYLMQTPPGLLEHEEYIGLSAELRDRGLTDLADNLSTFTDAHHIATPYVHDPTYKALEKASEKLKVYAANNELLILSPDPENIGKDDVIHIDSIDGVQA